MENRDKLILKVAERVGISKEVVNEVININHQLLKETMQKRTSKTFYLRKVGFFIPLEVRFKLRKEKIERTKQQNINRVSSTAEEFPLEFE